MNERIVRFFDTATSFMVNKDEYDVVYKFDFFDIYNGVCFLNNNNC